MHAQYRRRSSKSILIPRALGNNENVCNSINSYSNGGSTFTVSSSNYLPHQQYYHHPHVRNTNSTLARRMTVHLPKTIPDTTYLYGYMLLIATFIMFTSTLYSIVASKYMPDTHIKILDWIKYDDYYCLLIPITAIVWIYWVLWNWMGMKFFRHN